VKGEPPASTAVKAGCKDDLARLDAFNSVGNGVDAASRRLPSGSIDVSSTSFSTTRSRTSRYQSR